jgi:hypothetical protein
MKDMMEELRYDRYQQTDYVLCAVLLRLAEIFGWLSVKLLWNI